MPRKQNVILIYGDRATGKSTLEHNLRKAIVGSFLTEDNYTIVKNICFLGRTAKKQKGKPIRLLATGGAERMLEIDLSEFDKCEWVIASFTPGFMAKCLVDYFYSQNVHAMCLYSDLRREFYIKRTRHFSGREPKNPPGKARIRDPDKHGKCVKKWRCRTEKLYRAYEYLCNFLGFNNSVKFDKDIVLK